MAWKFNVFTRNFDYYEENSGSGSVPASLEEVNTGVNNTKYLTPYTFENADLWATKFDDPTGSTSQYIRGDGSLASFPTIPTILDDLNDVNVTSPTGGQGLIYNGTSHAWENTTIAVTGDMLKSVYDTDDDGVVDSSEREQIQVINKTGATLTKGTIVYIKPTSSSTNYPEVLKANATTEATSSKTIGAIYEDILDSAVGYIITSGQVHNLNTSAYVVGDKLWLSTTDGLVTTTPPAEPNHTVFIGHVTRSQTVNGRILYAIQNGYELDELHGVLVPSPATNDFLYFAADGLWKNKAIAGADITQSASYRFVTDTEKTTWNSKEPAITGGTTSQYWRGDKSFQTLDKAAVGLGNVDNTADIDKGVSTATTTAINTATSNTSILSKILTGLNITGGAITSTNTILEAFGQVQNQINTLFGQDIITVANYSALPAASTVTGKFYWCQAKQGTSWLPGSLGGTFYNAGLYHSNGTTWEYMEQAYQATQIEVDAGIVTDKFVTPATLASASKWATKADLASPTFMGTPAAPTATPLDNSTKIATTAYVDAAITASGGTTPTVVAGLTAFNFGSEEDGVVSTIADLTITSTTVISAFFFPQETTATSLDDFKLNGVTFSLENVVDNTSFDIRATAANNASGTYTIKYILQII